MNYLPSLQSFNGLLDLTHFQIYSKPLETPFSLKPPKTCKAVYGNWIATKWVVQSWTLNTLVKKFIAPSVS